MFGSFIGNVAGISYFLAFQILGILLALYLFQKEKTGTTLLFGSVFGSFALHWLPTIYAFFFQFSVKAHLFAFITFVAIIWAVLAFGKEHTLFKGRFKKPDIVALFRENPALFLLLPLFIYTCYVLLHATIPYINGSLHSGQSTYGDALRFYYKYCQAKNFPAGILHSAGHKTRLPIFIRQYFLKCLHLGNFFADSLSSADVFCLDSGLFRRLSFGKKNHAVLWWQHPRKKFSCYRSFLFQWRFRLLLLHE